MFYHVIDFALLQYNISHKKHKLSNTLRKISTHHESILNSGCFTKTTMISSGRHQISRELVVRVSTFRKTIFFSPLGSFLYPMLVLILMKIKNGWLGSAFIGWGLVFKMKGFYLSAIVDLERSPAVSSSW